MKKYIFFIASIAFFCLLSCNTNKYAKPQDDTDNKFIAGAYADFRDITNEEKEIFESTYKHKSRLTPQSVATQVVAGLNYRFICTDDSNHIIKVAIYKPLPNQGEPSVTGIEPLSEYDEILEYIRRGFDDEWQTISPEDIGVSYIYQYRSPSMGFAKTDINEDGIIELLLGDSMNDSYAIYDIFTYDAEAGTTKHIFCGGERDRCILNGKGVICREGSNSAFDSFKKYYQLAGNEMVEIKDGAINEDLKIIKFVPFKKIKEHD